MSLLNFFNVNIEEVLFCVCHMHGHDFPTSVHSLSFWDVNIWKTSWGTEVANSFFPCLARLWNSVPAYCSPLSYNLYLLKGNINMHLASLSITWKPPNKSIGNFISYPKSKLINWFEKWCPVFDISHIILSHSRCNCIHFGTLLYIILRLLSKHLCLLLFSSEGSVSLLYTYFSCSVGWPHGGDRREVFSNVSLWIAVKCIFLGFLFSFWILEFY